METKQIAFNFKILPVISGDAVSIDKTPAILINEYMQNPNTNPSMLNAILFAVMSVMVQNKCNPIARRKHSGIKTK